MIALLGVWASGQGCSAPKVAVQSQTPEPSKCIGTACPHSETPKAVVEPAASMTPPAPLDLELLSVHPSIAAKGTNWKQLLRQPTSGASLPSVKSATLELAPTPMDSDRQLLVQLDAFASHTLNATQVVQGVSQPLTSLLTEWQSLTPGQHRLVACQADEQGRVLLLASAQPEGDGHPTSAGDNQDCVVRQFSISASDANNTGATPAKNPQEAASEWTLMAAKHTYYVASVKLDAAQTQSATQTQTAQTQSAAQTQPATPSAQSGKSADATHSKGDMPVLNVIRLDPHQTRVRISAHSAFGSVGEFELAPGAYQLVPKRAHWHPDDYSFTLIGPGAERTSSSFVLTVNTLEE